MSALAFIIEDDQDLSTIFADALESVGYQVEQIKDGLKAQQRLTEEVPYLILLDMHLPHVSGAELLTDMQGGRAFQGNYCDPDHRRCPDGRSVRADGRFCDGQANLVCAAPRPDLAPETKIRIISLFSKNAACSAAFFYVPGQVAQSQNVLQVFFSEGVTTRLFQSESSI